MSAFVLSVLLLSLLLGVASAFSRSATVPSLTRQRHQQYPFCPLQSSSSSSSSATEFDYLETVNEGLTESGLENDWKAAATFLSETLSIELPEAEDSLARALNWRGWAVVKSKIARKFIKPVPPNLQQVEAALAWLREGPLAVPDTVLVQGVREHPDVYLLEPETKYGQALAVAPEEYRDPETFRETLLQMPSVLGCTYNCVDTGCNSDCGSCWVSFRTVLKQQSKESD